MSIKELNFALEQEQLPVNEQLAFIIIADSCNGYFTLGQAVEMVLRRTGLSESSAKGAVDTLVRQEFIIPTTRFEGSEKLYLILAIQS